MLREKLISNSYGFFSCFYPVDIPLFMRKSTFLVISGLFLVLVGMVMMLYDVKYHYWLRTLHQLPQRAERQTPNSTVLSSGLQLETSFSYPILDGPASLYFCQSWLYVSFRPEAPSSPAFLSGFKAMRQKRLGNFQTKEGAPAFETYYTLSGEHLTGDLFAIINGQTPFFQLQRYALEDFQYDREVKAYFCLSPDDPSQRYYYPLDNQYQNPELPLQFYPYFFSLAEDHEWSKIKTFILLLQQAGYSPLPFGSRYFGQGKLDIISIEVEKDGLLLQIRVANGEKRQYFLSYARGKFFLLRFPTSSTTLTSFPLNAMIEKLQLVQ